MIDGCMEDTTVVAVKEDGTIEVWFKNKINKWTNNIALFLGLLSIWAVIYGWLMMTLSTGEDEKIKKAKDIVKWSLLWLLWVILATTIVTLIINLIYGISSNI
jgi:low affinity Fe/Cu permease